MNLLAKLKEQQAEMRQFKPAQNLPVYVTGYDTTSEVHAVLGKITNDKGEEQDVRIHLAEDPKKAERRKPRAEIADRADPKHKAYVAPGGWLIAQSSYLETEIDGVPTYKSRWMETVTNAPNKGFAGVRMATVKFVERKNDRKERIIVTAYDPAKTEQVKSLDELKAALSKALTPNFNTLGPCALIRLSSAGEALAITANATRSLKEGEQYKSLDASDVSVASFLEGQQAREILLPTLTEESVVVEVIPGTRFNIPSDTRDNYFDNEGKLLRGDDDHKTIGEIYNNIYGELDESKFRQPRFTQTVVGVDLFEADNDTKEMIPFCRNFMPVNLSPDVVALEYIPSKFFKPSENVVKQVKENLTQAEQEESEELGLSTEDAAALSEIEEIMNQAPTPA